MAIWLTEANRVIVSGITGTEGRRHACRMLAAGTRVVGGTNPAKAGDTVDCDGTRLPVFGGAANAVAETGADTAVVFVPAAHAKAAMMEIIDAGIGLALVITEGIPVHDTAAFLAHAAKRGSRTRIIGPNCPGLASPGRCHAGIIPADIAGRGPLGLVSRSGTLTYQLMYELRDLGFSSCVGIGGDPLVGTSHVDALAAFERDEDTKAMILIGEIGGLAEEHAADYIRDHVTKPVIGYVAGFTAPPGRTMGHAGAIVSGSSGTAEAKKRALEAAGVLVGRTPSETARLAREVLVGQ